MSIKIFIYANRIDVHVSFQYTCSSLGENIVIFATIIVVSQHNYLWKCTAGLTFVITRVSVFALCVCLFVYLSQCLSGRFNYEGHMPHKQYFAGTLLGMPSYASYVSRTHDVIDGVTRSHSRSNFEIDTSLSIFELERRSKVQDFGNIKHSCNFTSDIKDHPKLRQKSIFHGDDVISDVTGWHQSFLPYSCLVEVGSGSKLQGQCLVNKCKYRNHLSRLYMSKENLYE